MGDRTRRKRRHPWLALAALGLFVFGCVEANPLPTPGQDTDRGEVPVPAPGDAERVHGTFFTTQLVFLSSLRPHDEGPGTVTLVGAPGSVSHEGGVRVERSDGVDAVELAADPGTGFASLLEEIGGDTKVTLTLLPSLDTMMDVQDGSSSGGDMAEEWEFGRLTLTVRQITEPGPEPPGDLPSFDGEDSAGGGADGPFLLTSPDENGVVTLTIAAESLTAFAKILVLNVKTGTSHAGDARNDGSVELRFAAMTGDVLSVFFANPNDPTKTTPAFAVTVP